MKCLFASQKEKQFLRHSMVKTTALLFDFSTKYLHLYKFKDYGKEKRMARR